MPELPEVHTTATMLKKLLSGHTISDVWTDYGSPYHRGKNNIKDSVFFNHFKKIVVGAKIHTVHRRAKNVLIELANSHTIIIHMKMTGHLLYGKYERSNVSKNRSVKNTKRPSDKEVWRALEPEALKDPFNQFIHFVIVFDNGRHLALSDMRKFAKVTVVPTDTIEHSEHLNNLGPEPLESTFTYLKFAERLALRPWGKIKQVLMDPSVIAGIGNIYSDEILWASSVHPLSIVSKIPDAQKKDLFRMSKEILRKGIDFGGDSTSDYRNPMGEHGEFHYHHKAYRQTNEKCPKKNCKGTIKRIRLGGRSAHFCDIHQKCYN